jgi:hypothetical protein
MDHSIFINNMDLNSLNKDLNSYLKKDYSLIVPKAMLEKAIKKFPKKAYPHLYVDKDYKYKSIKTIKFSNRLKKLNPMTAEAIEEQPQDMFETGEYYDYDEPEENRGS